MQNFFDLADYDGYSFFVYILKPIFSQPNFPSGGILDNKKLLSRNDPFNFRATFSLANKGIFARSEHSTYWKSAFIDVYLDFMEAKKEDFSTNFLLPDTSFTL